MQDEAGADAARFVVSEAWPIKYDPSDLNAKGNEVLIELLELVNEGIERVAVTGAHEMSAHRHLGVPDRDRVRAAQGLRRRDRHAAPARRDAAGDGGRRDPAAARSARAAEPGVSRVIVLARVITQARATCRRSTPRVIEGLFASDLAYLQRPLRAVQRRRRADGIAVPARHERPRGCAGLPVWGKHEGLSRESALRGDGLHRRTTFTGARES